MLLASRLGRSRTLRVLALTLVTAAVLLVPTGLARASGPNGILQGYVVSSVTSNAVPGATVAVTASDVDWVFQATTGAGGYYALSVPNHQYTVQVSAAAFDVASVAVNVGSGQRIWKNVSLVPASARTAVLQGYVEDSVSSAPVTVGRIVATTVSWAFEDYTNSSSLNATGFYRMSLIPGTYQITTVDVAGYDPYTSWSFSASSGSPVWWNVSLAPSPLVAWINGTVMDASTYAPLAGAQLTAFVGSLALTPAVANATGAFSLHVPVGTIEITADAAGHAPDTFSDYIYSAGAYSANVYLTPLAASERGWVRDGLTGAPIRGALVVASPFWSSGYFDQATSDAAGYFQLNLTADDFDLSATATGYTAWYSYAFLSTGDIVWKNVTLWPIISPVQGYVRDGATGSAVAGQYVYAYDFRSGYATYAVSDPAGFYSLLFPPSPAVTLRVNGYAPYAGAVAYPDVRPYVTTWVNLTLPRLDAELDIVVTDAITGLPISPAYANAYWNNGYNYGVTNATGFASVLVPAGASLTVGISATGYYVRYVDVPAFVGTYATSVALNPVLPTNVTVEGYVLDAATLLPISSAYVKAEGYDGTAPSDYTDGSGYYTLSIVARPQTILATSWRHALGTANVSSASATTLWVNFTLAPDTTSPAILNFTATPADNVGPSNPTTLQATINETSLSSTALTISKLWSSAGNLGTFLEVGQVPAENVSVLPSTRGNSSMTSVYDTRTESAILSDGASSTWWPALTYGYPYQDVVIGTFLNGSMSTGIYASAVFDLRSGRLLYVTGGGSYIDPVDQPTATFTPSAYGYTLNLATAAIVGYGLATGPSFQIGTLTATPLSALPSGEYAAVLEAYDAGSSYGLGAAFFNVTADTTPPVARAGASRTVNQGANVTLDGSASTDNEGITSYTWTFTDGTPQVLHGAVVQHVFLNAGVFVVTLTVTDASGNTGRSTTTVTVLDITPPIVALTAPADGATVSGSVALSATASDNVGVVRVEFLVDGHVLGNATAAPYSWSYNTTALINGNHTIEAIAFDAAGNSASVTRHVTVSNAPQAGTGLPQGLDWLPWIFILLIALVASGALVAVLLARRRKRRVPVPVPPPDATRLPPPPGQPPYGGGGPQGP